MKTPSCSHFRRLSLTQSERGAYVILMAMTVSLFLGLMTLVLDGASMFLTRLRVQAAVDNAITQAPLMIVGATLDKDEVEEALGRTVRANLSTEFSNSDIVLMNVAVDDMSVVINADVSQDLEIARTVFNSSSKKLGAETELTVPRINAAIVLDNSGSMGQEDSVVGNGQTKLTTAKAGLQEFAKWLRPNIDRVALITANAREDLEMPFRYDPEDPESPNSYGFNLSAATAVVLSVQTTGWSDLQGGLALARSEFDRIKAPPEEVNMVLVLSDGRPSSGAEVSFAPGSVVDLEQNPPKSGRYNYNLVLTNTQMIDHGGEVVEATGYSLRKAMPDGENPWMAHIPACDPSPRHMFPPLDPPSMSRCINALHILTPSRERAYWLPYTPVNVRKVHFLAPIAEADYLRERGAIVFAVGVGVDAGNRTHTFDPNLFRFPGPQMDLFEMQNHFLRRLTLDSASAYDAPFPGSPAIPPADHLLNTPIRDVAGSYFFVHGTQSIESTIRMTLGKISLKVVR